jgi:predicted flap endonuclease-1-like 5' DNA nuclease
MNNTAKNLIRVAGVVVGLGAAVWALRDRLLPAPEIHDEPPPRFREVAPQPQVPANAAELTDIKGVGPVTADKLVAAGITSVTQLAGTDPTIVSDSVGVSAAVADKWIRAAKNLT